MLLRVSVIIDGLDRCLKHPSLPQHHRVTNNARRGHIFHTTPRKMIVISYYYVQLWMLSILVYHHMGTLGKCQTDASKFITMDHFMTGGSHLYVYSCMCVRCPVCNDLLFKLQPSYTTFYRCCKDALAVLSLLAALCKLAFCQLKPRSINK